MSLIQDLKWRYSTKNMNGETISDEKLQAILTSINLTATSFGLQPFKIIVVSNEEIKIKLQAAAYGQTQVGSSSAVLVFAVPLKITTADIEGFINLVATTRSMPVEALDTYKGMILSTIGDLPAEQQQIWSAKQTYIALGTALAAAAEQKVDACPMEGFDAAQFDEILGLTEKGLKSVVIMPVGYRSADDATAQYIKVRKPESELFHFVK